MGRNRLATGRAEGIRCASDHTPPSLSRELVGNFVAFVESRWRSLTEAQRRGETEPRMDEWARMDGVFLTAKNAKNAKKEPRMDANARECTRVKME